MNCSSIATRLKLLLLATAALPGQAALSQETAATTQATTPSLAPEEIIVTGTNIRSTPDAIIVPVIALDAASLEKSGIATSVLEVLRKSIPAFEGRSNVGASNANNSSQFTAGGSQVQLRNLPTLVLINGRRAAVSGAAAVQGGRAFVDLNQIPLAAIERLEVLTDGASAVYGSDAIGGVVNLILKSDFKGLTVGARGAFADGSYSERSAHVVAGSNLAGVDFTLMASSAHSSPLLMDARSFTSPFFNVTSALPGTVSNGGARLANGVVSPSQNNPVGPAATATSLVDLIGNGTYVATTPAALSAGFDASPYQSLLLEQDNHAIALTFNSELAGDRLELFGDGQFSLSKSYGHVLPVAANGLTVPAGAPFNPLRGNFTGVTFAHLPTTHAFSNKTTAGRLTAGLRGRLGAGWRWESGLVYSVSDLQQTQSGLPFSPNLSRAIAGGFDASGNPVAGGGFSRVFSGFSVNGPLVLQPALDPFALAEGINPASLENLFGAEIIDARSTLASFDASINGSLFSLPAGSLDIAVGATARRETLTGSPDPNGRTSGENSQNWLGGIFFDPFSAQREVSALFVETRLPLTSEEWGVPGLRALDLILAGRFERYSDAGDSFAPKVGFRWQPFDRQMTIRGSWAESFAAPSLYFTFSPIRISRTSATLLSTAFGPRFSGMPFNSVSQGNRNLEPTTSTSKYLGVTLRPDFIPSLVVNVDYVNVELRDFPGSLTHATVLNSVNNLGSASPYYESVTADFPNGDPRALRPFATPGALLAFLTDPATGFASPAQALRLYNADGIRNLSTVSSKSLAITADYTVPTENLGTFTFSTVAAVLLKYDFTPVPGDRPVKLAGHSTSSLQFAGTLPKYSVRSSIDWTHGDATFTLGNTYMSSTTDTGANGSARPEIAVDRYVTWDVRAAYDFRLRSEHKLELAIGVNNIADEMPPLAPRAFPQTKADTSTFSPIGRLIYASLSAEF